MEEEQVNRNKAKVWARHYEIKINGEPFKVLSCKIKPSESRFFQGDVLFIKTKYNIDSYTSKKAVTVDFENRGNPVTVVGDFSYSLNSPSVKVLVLYVREKR